MPFIALKCPSCGAEIQMDNTREFGFCQYCGTKVIQDKQIIEKRIVYDHSESVINNMALAKKYFNSQQYDKAYKCVEKVLSWDVGNTEANELFDILNSRRNTPNLKVNLSTDFIISYRVLVDSLDVGKLSKRSPILTSISKGRHVITLQNKQQTASFNITVQNDFEKVSITFSPVPFTKKVNIHTETY